MVSSVSAVIPAYNAAAVVARAVESALSQGYPALEIVVVDDSSTDDTREIVRGYADRGVRLVELPENQGASACRNAGIRSATGRYVAFLDADDEWLPGKIEKQVAALDACADCSLAICDGAFVTPDGRVVETVLTGQCDMAARDAWKALLEDTFVHTSCVLARRDLLLALDGFDTGLVVAEDWDLWIRLCLAGPFAVVRERLVRVHVTPGSLMKREAANTRYYLLPMVKRHLREQRARLTPDERRRIWSAQLERVGRATCHHGGYLAGLLLLLRASALGRNPVRNLGVVVSGFPPLRRLRAARRKGGPAAG